MCIMQIENVCKEGEEEISKFQDFWDLEIQALIQNLKEIEENLCVTQKQEME